MQCDMSVTGYEEIFTTWSTDLSEVDASVVFLCGELDASSAPAFLTDMREVIDRGRDVIMDVHLLSYTDSTGVAAILATKNALQEVGRKLRLAGCHGLLTKILYTIRVRDDLLCYDDLDQAVQAVKTEQQAAQNEAYVDG